MWIYFSKKVLYLNAQYSRGFLFFVLFFNGEKFCFYIFPFSFKIIADLLLTDRVAHLVKSPPPMQKTWVQSLGWEDPLEKGMATHSIYSGLDNSKDYIVYGVSKSWTRLSDF